MREDRNTLRQRRERAERYEREEARRNRRNRDSRRRRNTGSRNKMLPVIIAIVVVAAAALLILGNGLLEEFGSSREHKSLEEYYGISSPDEVILIADNEIKDERIKVEGDKIYLPMSMASEYYDSFYYDSLEGHLLVTGATKTVEGTLGSDYLTDGDKVYISMDFLNNFVTIPYSMYQEPQRVEITTHEEGSAASLNDDAVMRTSADRKSPILFDLNKGEEVRVTMADDNWALVHYQAVNGYMETKYLDGDFEKKGLTVSDNEETVSEGSADAMSAGGTDAMGAGGTDAMGAGSADAMTAGVADTMTDSEAGAAKGSGAGQDLVPGPMYDHDYQKLLRDHKIVMGFHNVANNDANSYLADVCARTSGMNVIAPTWFGIADNEGNVYDISSTEYVAKAHEMGYEVWAVADNFTYNIDTNEVLAHTSKRLAFEQNLVTKVLACGADGINIDFEMLATETGDDFSQFLREMSILTRANNLVLSVDNYVPQDYTDFYRRDIQGQVADYVVIMGYDEHTSASDKAGSVASIGFVTEGIEKTLEEVPANQIINAVPFYTRKWAYEAGVLSCESMGMQEAATFLADNGVTAAWDGETCQKFATFDKNGVTYSIWLEDAESISSKLAVMASHDLAGVACWKLSQETPDIWDLISSYYGN